jgi:ribosomal protein L7Ae-like RNA K-turn-binding protein
MREKIHSYLGFSKRSRNLISGYHSCQNGIEHGKICLLILAEDLAENTIEKFRRMAIARDVPIRIYGTKKSLSEMAGESDRGIFGITDKNLAAVITSEIDNDGPDQVKE